MPVFTVNLAYFFIKMEARKRQGARTDLTSPPPVAKLRIDEAIGLESGDIKLKYYYCCFAIPIFAFEFD